ALEILAAVLGIDRMLGEGARARIRFLAPSSLRAHRRLRGFVALAALGGAACVVAASFVPYAAYEGRGPTSLYHESAWELLEPLAPALAAALVGLLLLVMSSIRRLVCGLLCGVVLF